jgi:hypothetical protein
MGTGARRMFGSLVGDAPVRAPDGKGVRRERACGSRHGPLPPRVFPRRCDDHDRFRTGAPPPGARDLPGPSPWGRGPGPLDRDWAPSPPEAGASSFPVAVDGSSLMRSDTGSSRTTSLPDDAEGAGKGWQMPPSTLASPPGLAVLVHMVTLEDADGRILLTHLDAGLPMFAEFSTYVDLSLASGHLEGLRSGSVVMVVRGQGGTWDRLEGSVLEMVTAPPGTRRVESHLTGPRRRSACSRWQREHFRSRSALDAQPPSTCPPRRTWAGAGDRRRRP